MGDAPRKATVGSLADGLLAAEAVYTNSLRPVSVAATATGFRTFGLRHDAARQIPAGGCALDFLVNSRLRRHDVEFESSVGQYFTDAARVMLGLVDLQALQGVTSLALPGPAPMQLSLDNAVLRRRSVRQYTGDSTSLAYLSAILRAANGITHAVGDPAGAESPLRLRSVPSGGGVYPLTLFVAILRVTNAARGIYTYEPMDHALSLARPSEAVEALLETIATPEQTISTSQANAIFLIVGRPWRSMRKYGPRGLRHMFLEAGAMAEHINLAATALGLGSVDCASFYDDEVHEVIGVDGEYLALVHSVIVGTPAE